MIQVVHKNTILVTSDSWNLRRNDLCSLRVSMILKGDLFTRPEQNIVLLTNKCLEFWQMILNRKGRGMKTLIFK
ncbi:rCG46469 [Rattus norvegicus]|uniref:RCG46469 n=1 Tax=Rattus norvegicus TaxID=10116 RepID=A6IDB4_RAT|nr:rCG46469 [Rattus norvegicus]